MIRTGTGAILSFSTTILFSLIFVLIDNSTLQGNGLLAISFLLSFVYLFAYLSVLSSSIVIVDKIQKKRNVKMKND